MTTRPVTDPILASVLNKPGTTMNKLDNFLTTPGGGFLMNLLAQSGYSTMPQSPFGAIGKAALMTQNQQRQGGMDKLNEELIRAKIGLYGKQAEMAGKGERVVQSAQPLANGNIGYLDAFSGEVVDTGQKAGGKGQVIDMPGIGQVVYDPIQGTLTQVNPEDVIRDAGAERAGAQQAATTAATESTKREFNVPQRIRAAETQIRSIDQTLEEASRAAGLVNVASTGVIGAMTDWIPGSPANRLQNAIKPIQAALSFDKLSEMRAASPTGGALGQVSERELDLLQNSLVSLEQAQTPGDMKRALMKVLTHYHNWKGYVEQDAAQLQSGKKEDVAGFRIVD